jgi:hypothetical protein
MFGAHISEVIVGITAIVSTAVGMLLTHVLERRKARFNIRSYPLQVLYSKQTEFFDKLIPLLDQLNGYITTIDVWLGERGKRAAEEVRKASGNCSCVDSLATLLEQYYLYLPRELLNEAKDLRWKCFDLRQSPTLQKTEQGIDALFEFQNSVRRFVGVDELSRDLLKAFGSESRKTRGTHELDE